MSPPSQLNVLQYALKADLSTTLIAAVFLGVVFHQSIRPYEVDNRAWLFLGIYSAFTVVAIFSYAAVAGYSILGAIGRTWLVEIFFNLGLLSSIGIYRLYFHRLRNFPGPWGAKLSRFWAFKQSLKSIQFNYVVEDLHKQYGDFVRIGPREISVNSLSGLAIIYGPPSNCPKSPWYSQVSDDVTQCSVNSTRDMSVHRLRRRAWDRGLGFKALASYEPRVQFKTDELLRQIAARQGQPMDITKWAMFYTFDVMGDVGLGKDFEMLKTGGEHKAVKGLHDQMTTIGTLGTLPWLLAFFGSIPGISGTFQDFFQYCHDQVQEKQRITGKDQEPRDILSWLIKAKYENDQSAPPSDFALGEDSRLLVIAGSDTTAAAIACAFYYLVKNPVVLQKLRSELDEIFPNGDSDWTYEKSKLPYLDNIINETLRLKPPVPGGLPRLTPAQGVEIDGVFIPGDTVVGVPTHTIQRDPRYFDRPLEFIPERWEKITPERSAFIPFSRGAFGCAGKQLALMELRMALSRVVRLCDISFAPREDGVKFDTEVKDTFTLTLPPLSLIFTPRTAK